MRTYNRNVGFIPRMLPGFTLIELLVVIAIIGILSAVVLASLNAARAKGDNAGVQSSFSELRNEGNVYYTVNGNYGTVTGAACTTVNTIFISDAQFKQILGVVQTDAGNAPVCNSTTQAWAVGVKLATPIGTNNYLCTDSIGMMKSEASIIGSGVTACP